MGPEWHVFIWLHNLHKTPPPAPTPPPCSTATVTTLFSHPAPSKYTLPNPALCQKLMFGSGGSPNWVSTYCLCGGMGRLQTHKYVEIELTWLKSSMLGNVWIPRQDNLSKHTTCLQISSCADGGLERKRSSVVGDTKKCLDIEGCIKGWCFFLTNLKQSTLEWCFAIS